MQADTSKHLLTCITCMVQLQAEAISSPGFFYCPSCGMRMHITAFPALLKEVSTGKPGESLMMDDEAACFYHPGKKAVIPCSACGRYLCALCDVDINNQHLCPPCIETGKTEQKLKNMVTQRTLYGKIAFLISTLPLIFWFVTIITAPAAIYMVIRYWNAPPSIISGNKFYFVLAFIIAGIQITIWVVVIYGWVKG